MIYDLGDLFPAKCWETYFQGFICETVKPEELKSAPPVTRLLLCIFKKGRFSHPASDTAGFFRKWSIAIAWKDLFSTEGPEKSAH